jgi:hypothetical protein
METQAKSKSSTNLRFPIEHEKGRAFTGVHGVDWAVWNGPNAFLEEMAGGNSGIRGMEVLGAVLGKEAVERDRARDRGARGWKGETGEDNPHPILFT